MAGQKSRGGATAIHSSAEQQENRLGGDPNKGVLATGAKRRVSLRITVKDLAPAAVKIRGWVFGHPILPCGSFPFVVSIAQAILPCHPASLTLGG
jgi:hypothetical protein